MQRTFELKEIGSARLGTLCTEFDMPENATVVESRGRYCLIKDRIEFPDLDGLLASARDGTKLTQAWDPSSPYSAEEVEKLLQDDAKTYLDVLRQREVHLRRLLVKLKIEKKPDTFVFDKDLGVWLLRYARIPQKNFGFYEFKGIDVSDAVLVSGIYIGAREFTV